MTADGLAPGRDGILAGLTGTILAHGLLLGFLLLVTRQVEQVGTVYAVNLVAAPAPSEAPRRTAAEAPPRPVERTAPVEPPTRTARPAPPPTTKAPTRAQEAPVQTANPVTPMPGETPSTGTDVANVVTPGVDFPFPEYLRRIVNEIYRRWQRPAGTASLQTEIRFVILRDGSVQDIEVARRSRNYSFDLGARGAVEAAATARAFGPLPEGFQGEVLAISLRFAPRTTP